MEKILWATDRSPHAHAAGLRVPGCARCTDRLIDVVTVVDPDELPPILPDVPDPLIAEEAVHEAERRPQAGYEERVRRPSDQILAAGREPGSDLIVMGSHGRRSLEALLLGGTIERVTRHADCPVMVVR